MIATIVERFHAGKANVEFDTRAGDISGDQANRKPFAKVKLSVVVEKQQLFIGESKRPRGRLLPRSNGNWIGNGNGFRVPVRLARVDLFEGADASIQLCGLLLELLDLVVAALRCGAATA